MNETARSIRWPDLLVALACALLAYGGSCLLLPAAPTAFSYGVDYQLLSADPFALGGKLPQRLLGPLLAWLCGCGGARYPQFLQGVAVLLLAVVALRHRRHGAGHGEVALLVAAVAVTGAVQTYKRVVGFPDQLSWLLLLLAHDCRRRPGWFWLLNFASLLNHESLVFFLPFLLWERRRAGARWQHDVLGLGLALGAYALWRWYVGAHAGGQSLDASWYTGQSLFPLGTLWLWVMTAVYWVTDFGPLLILLAAGLFVADRGERIGWLLLLAGLLSIYALVFVYDFFRFGSVLVVPLVLLAPRALRPATRRLLLAVAVPAAAAWSYWWHLPPAGTPPTPGYHAVGDLDRRMLESGAILEHRRLFTVVLPQVWPLLLGIALAGLAFVAAGLWLARRERIHDHAAP